MKKKNSRWILWRILGGLVILWVLAVIPVVRREALPHILGHNVLLSLLHALLRRGLAVVGGNIGLIDAIHPLVAELLHVLHGRVSPVINHGRKDLGDVRAQ